MPIRRSRLILSAALTGVCALLAIDGQGMAAAADAAARTLSGIRGPDRGTERSATARRGAVAHRPPHASAPLAPPADSATVRRAADLVRRARDAERAAGSTGGTGAAAALDPTLADSARRTYLAAAALVPDVGDWLRLRAAGVTRAPADRAGLLRGLTVPAARERAPYVDALARARTGDPTGAAATLDSLGRPAQALTLRLQAATDPGARAAVRASLLDLLRPSADTVAGGVAESPRERVRTAAALLDSAFSSDAAAPLTSPERLIVAHALAAARDPATLRRAAAEFAGARAGAGQGAPADLFEEAGVLARLGQWREAATAYGRLQGAPAPFGPAAAYERGRALVRAGDAAGARAALRAVADAGATGASAAGDTAAAAARFLLAELTADDGQESAARAEYLRTAQEHPDSRLAPLARFRAGVIALAAGDARSAAGDFDAVARAGDAAAARTSADSGRDSGPDSVVDPTAIAGAYWAGRAWAAAGDSVQARARWTLTLARDPASYYAWRAAVRLGRSWMPTAAVRGAPPLPVDAQAEAVGRRAALLERVGLTPEAGYERDALIRGAGESPDRLLAVAHALATGPRPGAGIRLAARAVERGAPRSPAVWQLLDPLFYADALRRSAVAAGVDPALAAGVIRQESNFTADAVSPVGARGLMQLMPDVGRGLWRGEGASAWSPDLLFVPEVNLALGMRHLAAGLRGYPDPAYALAAYNAGGARVTRWRRQPGADDPELFVERIPYAETRDYVRIVLRNRELYRALYRL